MRPSTQPRNGKSIHALLRELSDDEDDTMVDIGTELPDDPQQPWLRDYRAYIDVVEQVPKGRTTIQWWGVSDSVGMS